MTSRRILSACTGFTCAFVVGVLLAPTDRFDMIVVFGVGLIVTLISLRLFK